MNKTISALALTGYIGMQVIMPEATYAHNPRDSSKKTSSSTSLESIEKLRFMNPADKTDMPNLKDKLTDTKAEKDGINCVGEWYKSGDYLVSKTICNGTDLAYGFFSIDQDQKVHFEFGFYNSGCDGIFKKIYDLHDRPLPGCLNRK